MGNLSRAFTLAFITGLIAASPAAAGVPHVVQPGETLWTIAAANNFTTRALAAANGLSENSNVVLGSTITTPSVGGAAAAMTAAGIPPAPASSTTATATTATTTSTAPAAGGYAVQPGDTL